MNSATEIPAAKNKRVPSKKAQLPFDKEGYVRYHFPKQGSEFKATYNPVGPKQFRINFYTYVDAQGCRDARITRSLYVSLKQASDGSWTHEVFDN